MTKKLESTWVQAAAVVASGGTLADAASVVGVTDRTLRTWRADYPQFDDAIAELQAEMFRTAGAILARASVGAAETLDTLCRDESLSPALRISAAKAIIDLGDRYREARLIEDRLTSLELRAGVG